jgi:Rrf2 family iron-sulfur cluster assembly transcriptional regulator
VPTPATGGFDRSSGTGEPFGKSDVVFSSMSVLPRRALLAIAAVVEVALQGHERPIAAKSLASRHGLPPRHLETVLQALVREGILRGIRGPRGGYQLARKRQHVSAGDILRASGAVEGTAHDPTSDLMVKVVLPALSVAESEFEQALGRLSLERMAQLAESANANETLKKRA